MQAAQTRLRLWLALSLTVLWLTTTSLFGAQLLSIIFDRNDNWLSLGLLGAAWFIMLGITNMAWRSWLRARPPERKPKPAGPVLRGRAKAPGPDEKECTTWRERNG